MSDEIREKFEKLNSYQVGSDWAVWDGDEYVKSCKGFNLTADAWSARLNKELAIFKAGHKSRDDAFECLRTANNILRAKEESRDEEVLTLTSRVAVAEGKNVELEVESKELHTACNNYKQMYVDKMAESKKLREALGKILSDCSNDLGGRACSYIEQALKDGE